MKGHMGQFTDLSVLRGTRQDIFSSGFSTPHASTAPLPGDSSHTDTPPRGYSRTCTRHRYSTRGVPRSHSPGKTCLNDSSQILPSRHNPHHSHPQLTPRSPQLLPSSVISKHYHIIGTTCLSHSQTIFHPASHHK